MGMKLVILDRDGTIGRKWDEHAGTASGWQAHPGALEAIAKLNHSGWHVVIAANLDGLGSGLDEMATINAQQARLHKLRAAAGGKIDAMFFCPHRPTDPCDCRKPRPGLFRQIGERFGIDLRGIPAVGDTLDDALAAAACGCEPHLVLTGEGVQYHDRPIPSTFPAGTRVHADLAAFAEFLIDREVPPQPDVST